MARCEDCLHYEVCKHHAKMLEEDGYEIEFDDTPEVEKRCAAFKPPAAVVPKSESLPLDVHEALKQRAVEKAKAEVLEEFEERIATHAFTSKSEDYSDGAFDTIAWVDSKLAELKKKYTEGE